jgi:hypothetical protein
MPRAVQKSLAFPLAGVSRSRGYRDQSRPYFTPWAENVRGVGPIERRLRGGSRPGLSKVVNYDFGNKITSIIPITSVDGAGLRNRDLIVCADGVFNVIRGTEVDAVSSELLTDEGVTILAENGEEIIFESSVGTEGGIGASMFDAVERNGALYLADSVLRQYNPLTGVVESVQAKHGTIPSGCPLVCLYRDRLFLSGADHLWYASRQGDVSDWDFGADPGDVGRAVAGQCSRAGVIGEPITAMIPHGDYALMFATQNELWVLRGDPANGTISRVSETVGVLSPTGWAMAPDGTIAFLSNDGIYMVGVGEGARPERFSSDRVPEQLLNVDWDANSIVMAYDPVFRGFHLFITPPEDDDAPALGQHWWIDTDNKALWPVSFQEGHQPVAAARVSGSGLAEVFFGCRDGYIRKFSAAALDDDGESIVSQVLLGPFRIAADDVRDAMLTEIHGALADNSGTVVWRIVTAQTAEEAADTAVAGMALLNGDAGTRIGVLDWGEWTENRNKVARVRARGPWAVVWLASNDRWSYENVAIAANQLGRLR